MSNSDEDQYWRLNYQKSSFNFDSEPQLFDLNSQNPELMFRIVPAQQNPLFLATFSKEEVYLTRPGLQAHQNYENSLSSQSYKVEASIMKTEQVSQNELQFSKRSQLKIQKCKEGLSSDTENIGKHLRTFTLAFLRMLADAHLLSQEERKAAMEFKSKNGGLEDFKKLFQHQSVKKYCREYFQSPIFIRAILSCPKTQLRNKIFLIKHLSTFRKLTFFNVKSWKNEKLP